MESKAFVLGQSLLYVPHIISPKLITQANKAWLRLLREMPYEILAETQMIISGDTTPDGYSRKEGADVKHFFHYTGEWKKWARGKFPENETLTHFIRVASCLQKHLIPPALAALDLFDQEFPYAGLRGKFLSGAAEPDLIIRFLAYDIPPPGNKKETLAKAHVDRSGLTLHVDESHPGLQVKIRGEWVDVEARRKEFPIMIGNVLHTNTKGALAPTEHRVVARDGEPIARDINIARTAIVCFFDPQRNHT